MSHDKRVSAKMNKNHSTHRHKSHQKRQFNEHIPDGFVEDWPTDISDRDTSTHDQLNRDSTDHSIEPPVSNQVEHLQKKVSYHPVSIVLSLERNLLLTKETSYDIRFTNGILEGSGIQINEAGTNITFSYPGSYRFEICGEATSFSDVDVKLQFYSEQFEPDIKPFTETIVPRQDGKLQLRGLASVLPIHKNQTIIARLIPIPDESILLLAQTRLIIYRVA